ncbi:hypothetical protein RVX_R13990 [Nitratidesulfovibrio sp. HK-II]|uniref:hypothetical protein n=1 Tax=Nitratidesulfovibrio sp. HK-II TaxID=2009266 RepID=UPI000ECA9392|nr:hypothetical protein [Nitratidesulfovibrio sp. HK-II]GBO95719.1 hypothetical protein RVX_0759 [Nitratidesulfovibrio sp. HK-II]
MSISSIYSSYGTYGIDLSMKKTQEQAESGSSSLSASSSSTSSSSSNTVTGLSLDYLSQLSAVLKEISPNASGKLTFSMVEDYRKDLEEEFSAKVREDLTKLGVDKDVEFRVVTNDKTGGVSVITDSEDKAKIEKYFKDNPDMVKKFQKIQTLSNLEKARKAEGYSAQDVKTRLQMEAMSAWWSEDGASSQIMDFTGGQATFLAGLSARV